MCRKQGGGSTPHSSLHNANWQVQTDLMTSYVAIPDLSRLGFCDTGCKTCNGISSGACVTLGRVHSSQLGLKHRSFLGSFTTGSHPRDRIYEPIDIDDVGRHGLKESSLREFRTMRSKAAISILIKVKTSDDAVARELVSMGEGSSKRLLGYHPNGTFDVDVMTAQDTDNIVISFTDRGFDMFYATLRVVGSMTPQLQRMILKRAVIETRMVFTRVAKSRGYTVELVLPDGERLQETVVF